MRIEVDCERIKRNTEVIVKVCAERDIEVVGVTKACCGHPEVARAMLAGGVNMLAESRLQNVQRLREATELMVQMIGPFMPHLAEECWARLGYNTLLADQPWPEPEPALLVDDVITVAVQVNGKRRGELNIARGATNDQIEAAALELDGVVRALAGKPVKRVIVVPQRIVNVVA